MGNGVLGHKIWTFEGWTFLGKERERVSLENSSTVGRCVGLDKTDREIGLIVYCWKIQ